MRLRKVQTNFSSGELDPELHGQVNLTAYENGAKRVRNCQARTTGGLQRRFGTFDLNGVTDRARVMGFEFSNTQRYVLAASAALLEIFDLNGAPLQSLAAPWTEAQAFDMTFTQQADNMILSVEGMHTQILKRTGATSFTLSDFAFDASVNGRKVYQPYFKFADPEVTLEPSAVTGAVTLTASAALFDAEHIGERFRIYEGELEVTAVASATSATATVNGEFKGKLDTDPFKTLENSTVVEVLHPFHGLSDGETITFDGSNTVGFIPGDEFDGTFAITVVDENRYKITLTGVSYDLREDINQDGVDETNTYTSAKSSEDGGGPNVTFTVAGAATRAWLEPALNDYRGWPGACAFHEGRLWLAGTKSQPDGIFGSKATQYFNFDVGEGFDGDSVQAQVGSEDASRILHVVSNGDLLIFTPTQEAAFIIRDGEPITPNNQRVKTQSDTGCSQVQPCVHDGAVLFVQENGLQVSELAFSGEEGGYVSTPISQLAGHLISYPVSLDATKGMKNLSESQAYIVNDDGTVAVFKSIRRENIAAWGLWTLGAGEVQSVACIGPFTYFCVSVRGAYRLYRLADDELNCLDGQVSYSSVGDPQSVWTLDERVRDRAVAVRSEFGYHGMIDVPADGVIDLEFPVEYLVAGDPFYWEIETLPPALQVPAGTRVGSKQRIVQSIIQLKDTYSITIGGKRIETRNSGESWGDPVTPLNGFRRVGGSGFRRDPTQVISQDQPLPAVILSIVSEVKI